MIQGKLVYKFNRLDRPARKHGESQHFTLDRRAATTHVPETGVRRGRAPAAAGFSSPRIAALNETSTIVHASLRIPSKLPRLSSVKKPRTSSIEGPGRASPQFSFILQADSGYVNKRRIDNHFSFVLWLTQRHKNVEDEPHPQRCRDGANQRRLMYMERKYLPFESPQQKELFERIRALCLSLPGTSERLSHGAPTFFIQEKRSFVMYQNNHHGDGRIALWCASEPDLRDILAETEPDLYFVPPYVGHLGWIGVRLDRDAAWKDVASLILASYKLRAPKKWRDAVLGVSIE
jgi:hypothetical protein